MKRPMGMAVKVDCGTRFNAVGLVEELVVPTNQSMFSENLHDF